jgi:hypothetical protein
LDYLVNKRKDKSADIHLPFQRYLMSWNTSCTYCSVTLSHILSKKSFDALLGELAIEIWQNYHAEGEMPEHFQGLDDDIPEEESEGIPFIVTELWLYIKECECDQKGTSLLLFSEYDTQCHDTELLDLMRDFFLIRSDLKYCITQTSSADKGGNYAHSVVSICDGERVLSLSASQFANAFVSSGIVPMPPLAQLEEVVAAS